MIAYNIKAIVFFSLINHSILVHPVSFISYQLEFPARIIDNLHACMQAVNNSASFVTPVHISAAVCTSSHRRHPSQNLIARPCQISQGRCHRETCMPRRLSWGSSIREVG
jgi:hypothetical protein